MISKPVYYPVWISPNRKAGGWSWGAPCDTPQAADKVVTERIDAGSATLGCIVRTDGDGKRPLLNHLQPAFARKIAQHWESLIETTR